MNKEQKSGKIEKKAGCLRAEGGHGIEAEGLQRTTKRESSAENDSRCDKWVGKSKAHTHTPCLSHTTIVF